MVELEIRELLTKYGFDGDNIPVIPGSALAALVERALTPAGFEIVSVSKVPYLCRGDMRRNYYVLADAIIVARKCASPASALGVGAAAAAAAMTPRHAGADAARNDVERAALLPALPAPRSRREP